MLYDPIRINDLMPSLARDRYPFVESLKENGCQLNAVLFTFSTGNNKGNDHFLWLTEVDASGDEIQSRNTGVVQKITDNIPKYLSRAIKQKLVCLVEWLTLNPLIYVKCIGS